MNWYYSKDGTQHGPVTQDDLQTKIRSGEVARDALVWRDGMSDWTAAHGVNELADATREIAPGGSVYAAPGAQVSTSYPALPSTKPTSGLAIASLVCGIVGLISCMFIPGIPAVICGHMAMKRTDPVTGNQNGRGMAVAGLVTGYIGLVLGIVIIGFYVLMIIGAVASGSSY
jgi:hypothetical protein